MKTESAEHIAADPSEGQAATNRRRALVWLGYGAAGLAAVSAGYLGWRQQNRSTSAISAFHPLTGVDLQDINGLCNSSALFRRVYIRYHRAAKGFFDFFEDRQSSF